jgi:hypothetical protein
VLLELELRVDLFGIQQEKELSNGTSPVVIGFPRQRRIDACDYNAYQ